jgi:hypothetical protein
MILKIIVLVALALYLALNKQYLFSVWALLCLIPYSGLFLAILLAVVLLFTPYWIAGVILATLIAINLIGNEIVNRRRRSDYTDKSDITVNFIRYCKEYFIVMKGFYEDQADLAVLDPHLGQMMDEIKGEWALGISSKGNDPDEPLISFKFDSPEMETVNSTLDEYAGMFKSRKQFILDYLREIGHPMGYSA